MELSCGCYSIGVKPSCSPVYLGHVSDSEVYPACPVQCPTLFNRGGIAPQEHPKGFNWGVFHWGGIMSCKNMQNFIISKHFSL